MNKLLAKGLTALLIVAFIASVSPNVASAQATSTTALVEQIQALLQQIKILQVQLADLQTQQGEVVSDLRETLQLTRSLSQGMTSDEVKLLQEILATDPDIYPEGLVTGFFGPLTEKAVKKFQAKFGIDQVGVVGPQTRAQINKLLTDGAGNSGKVPPGLLIASGIAKKLGMTPVPPSSQLLPPGIAKKLPGASSTPTTTPDTTAPVISSLTATSTASTTATISWTTNESATGKVWYGDSSPVDTSGDPDSANTTLQSDHSFTLTGLIASTTYYYVVLSADDAGNVATSSEQSLVTAGE